MRLTNWLDANGARIRGDRDGLITLRDAINDALKHGKSLTEIAQLDGETEMLVVERVGP